MFYILWWVIWAILIGLIAKVLHPGQDPKGLFPTLGIGILGSFVGGSISWLLGWGNFLQSGGLITSIVGAVIVCYAYKKYSEYKEKKND